MPLVLKFINPLYRIMSVVLKWPPGGTSAAAQVVSSIMSAAVFPFLFEQSAVPKLTQRHRQFQHEP